MKPICYITRRCKFCGEWKELTEHNIKRNYSAEDLRRVAAWMDVWGNQTDKFKGEPAAA